MEKKSKRELLSRLLLIVGGSMALIFGLLTALIPNLAYVKVTRILWGYNQLSFERVYLPFKVQLHESSFALMMASVGGFLGLLSSVKRDLLCFTGDFLGVLGVVFYSPPIAGSIIIAQIAYEPWLGFSLTLVGISIMFIGSMVKSEGWHRLTLLGIPSLLTIPVIIPFLIAINDLPLLFSFRRVDRLIGLLLFLGYFIGFTLMHIGSVIGFLKSITKLTRIPYFSH